MGSGILIRKAIIYYGKENFARQIIKWCKTSREKWKSERDIITPEIISNPKCYNLITGGKRKTINTFKVSIKTKDCHELFNIPLPKQPKVMRKSYKNKRGKYRKKKLK